MARQFRLRPAPGAPVEDEDMEPRTTLDRRLFMKYAFNAAGGVIATASLGAVGFASLLMGQASSGDTDSGVRYWVPKGQEENVWYGDLHLETMTKSALVTQAATSATGMSGAQGVWNGLPVNIVYIPHEENASKPPAEGVPRIQFDSGYNAAGAYIGHGEDVLTDPLLAPHDNILLLFSRCPHLCCIPGWQLVANDFTADTWLPGGVDAGGNKLFCICHSSRYDPTVLEMNENRNRTNGSTFKYFGVRRTGGPAPVGLPLIPFAVNGDIIEGLPDYMDWYTFCD
jgi:Rieske Fe-S protein